MPGLIILVGIVVNNAILILHQSLNNVRYNNLAGTEAISEAIKTRSRPIFMRATTTLDPTCRGYRRRFKLYRGLGPILLGGLIISTMFTFFVIPPACLCHLLRTKSDRGRNFFILNAPGAAR